MIKTNLQDKTNNYSLTPAFIRKNNTSSFNGTPFSPERTGLKEEEYITIDDTTYQLVPAEPKNIFSRFYTKMINYIINSKYQTILKDENEYPLNNHISFYT